MVLSKNTELKLLQYRPVGIKVKTCRKRNLAWVYPFDGIQFYLDINLIQQQLEIL